MRCVLPTPYQTINVLCTGLHLAVQRDHGARVSNRIDRNGVAAVAWRGLAHKTLPRVASLPSDTRKTRSISGGNRHAPSVTLRCTCHEYLHCPCDFDMYVTGGHYG